MDDYQESLFPDIDKPKWEEQWEGMPEFVQEKQEPYACINFRFDTEEDLQEFCKLIGQRLNSATKSAWYPFKSHWGNTPNLIWVDDE